MKVELDLSTEQLEGLDKSLSEVLLKLTDEQYTQILSEYIRTQFKEMFTVYTTSWGSKEKKLSDFGKQLLDNLQKNIEAAITKELLADEALQAQLDPIKEDIRKNLGKTVQSAIVEHVMYKVFTDKYEIMNNVNNSIAHMYNNRGY
jgi:hypothetical protein